MNNVERLLGAESADLLIAALPALNIYEKVFLLSFLKSKQRLTTEIKAAMAGSFYKIKALNPDILLVASDKYEELIAHLVLNMLCTDYVPDLDAVRIMQGLAIFAKNQNKQLLFAMLYLALSDLDYCLTFVNSQLNSTTNYYVNICKRLKA